MTEIERIILWILIGMKFGEFIYPFFQLWLTKKEREKAIENYFKVGR
jgi:hypothetical protein